MVDQIFENQNNLNSIETELENYKAVGLNDLKPEDSA